MWDGQKCMARKRGTGKCSTNLQDTKMWDWKTWHQTAGLENVGKAVYGKPKLPNGELHM